MVKFIGKVADYKVTKKGGWTLKTTDEVHTFSGYKAESVGRVDIVVTINRKTGQVSGTKCTTRGRNYDNEMAGTTIAIGGAVVLNAVDTNGNILARKAVIYNEFNL